MKKIPIALLLTLACLALLLTGCQRFVNGLQETPADQCNFDFDYSINTLAPERGADFAITTELINAGRPYVKWYTGTSTLRYPHASVTLYTLIDGKEHIIPHNLVSTDDVVEHWTILRRGQRTKMCYPYILPADAPAGAYHLRLRYLDWEKTVENVFTLEELPE